MTADPEKQLFCAVILQAVEDATCPLGPNRRRNTDITSARDWLTKPNRDFASVCRMAGYEPSRVRGQIIKRLAEVTPHDCPPPPKPRKPHAPRIRKTNTTISERQEANADC
jgi:hypothetical protein